MIEIIILNHLSAELGVPVALEKPEPAPDKFVLLDKIGSGRSDRMPSATFAFQSYAKTLFEAAELNEQVKIAVDSLIALDEIRGLSLNSDYNFTDTTTKQYRYQAVYDINHY